MSDNFFRINRGVTLNPQSEYGSGDPVGTNGDIYYNNVLGKFRKFQNGFWTDLDVSGGGGGSGSPWVAQEVPLTVASTSESVGFSTPQADTSYVVFAMMENLVDPNPKFQQVEVTQKNVNGFTVQWNVPLDTVNYTLSFIVPPKWVAYAESSVISGATSSTVTFPFPQAASSYGVIAQFQNTVDALPQFQTLIVNAKTTANASFKWNDPTDTANYKIPYMLNATSQVAVGSGATSAILTLPVDYGSTAYGIVVTAQNTVDPTPKFQPMLVTAKGTNNVTISWNDPTDTANYVLTCYAISTTP